MINKILKVIEEHTVLDRDLQKVIKAEYPYKETLASDLDDLFALYIVSQQRELLLDFLSKVNGNLIAHPHFQMNSDFVDDYLKSNNCG